MMENDDKLISQFMHANKHEIEDNGFSRRVIRQLPEHAKWMSDVLTTVCTVLCCILFYVFNRFKYCFIFGFSFYRLQKYTIYRKLTTRWTPIMMTTTVAIANEMKFVLLIRL